MQLRPSDCFGSLNSCHIFQDPAVYFKDPTYFTITSKSEAKMGSVPYPHLSLLQTSTQYSELTQIHANLIKLGLINNTYFSTRLIASLSLSSSSHNLSHARALFSCDTNPNAFTFNVLIRGSTYCNQPIEALLLFCDMVTRSTATPNQMTFPFVFKSCADARNVEFGRIVHGFACKIGCCEDPFIRNALLNMYVKNGCFSDAHKLFDRMDKRDAVTYNTMIGGFVDAGLIKNARDLFDCMENKNVATWNCLIRGYVNCDLMDTARGLFDRMLEKDVITWNTMINGYVKFGRMEKADELFQLMPKDLKDLITFNAMISGYSKTSRYTDIFEVFKEMILLNVEPNNFTLVSVLLACSQLSALEQGEWVHSYIRKCNIRLDAVLGTTLLDMYAKCGDMDKALDVFNDMEEKDIGAWNCIISNLGIHGKGKEALEIFSKLLEPNTKPDEITFLSVLSACRHCGLVVEGRNIFNVMSKKYNITPKGEHFGCMVDLLCRAYLLDEAKELIENNSHVEFSVAMWGALLEASSRTGNVEMGEYAAKHLLEIDPNDARCYVALANLYSRGRKWEDSVELRRKMRHSGIEKIPGCSSIEVDGVFHEFRVQGNGFEVLDEIL